MQYSFGDQQSGQTIIYGIHGKVHGGSVSSFSEQLIYLLRRKIILKALINQKRKLPIAPAEEAARWAFEQAVYIMG
jgi:hypothetical protein